MSRQQNQKSKLSVTAAAWALLKKHRRPMHYREITSLILAKCSLHGKTPHETVRSQLATHARFKRVAEGTYALALWEEYPLARFAKDIAFDVLKTSGGPMFPRELGEAIRKERQFVGNPTVIARNAIRADDRFYYDSNRNIIGLSVWKTKRKS